jgi:hypothetical protein
MTSNDAQIDVLLRRYAGHSQSNSATEHLDADELNAFAEGSLPEGARARYVSHLADCDNCRQIVSQLAISSGAVIAAEATTARDSSGYSWWKRLSGFLSPLTLRYAAFAMVLIAVAGVVFLVIRRPRESTLVAQNEQTKLGPVSAVKPPNETMPPAGSKSESVGNENKQGLAPRPQPSLQSSPSSDQTLKLDASKSGDTPASPPKVAKEAEVLSSPSLAMNKKGEAVQSETVPSYAPPPPGAGQRAETQSRQQQNVAGIASASGPRQSQQQPTDTFKMPDRGRADVSGKDIREDDKSLAVNQTLARKRAGDEKAKGPRRDMENNSATNRNSNEVRDEVTKPQGVLNTKPAASASEEKPPETRSAGGRKFKRQGSLWVDAKFKSSMTLKSISRGSSEFAALDSGLRAIAQQIGGEVIVVWKNKAYLIK